MKNQKLLLQKMSGVSLMLLLFLFFSNCAGGGGTFSTDVWNISRRRLLPFFFAGGEDQPHAPGKGQEKEREDHHLLPHLYLPGREFLFPRLRLFILFFVRRHN